MIVPTKHIGLNESLLAGGDTVLRSLLNPQTVSGLWDKVRKEPSVANFERYTLILDFLFLIGAIDMSDGLLARKERQ